MPIHQELIGEARKQLVLENPELAFLELGRWLDAVRRHFDRYDSATSAAGDNVKAVLKKIGFRRWEHFWHYGRQLIPLQHRLLIEQVYSDLGSPWSDLVTGFGALPTQRYEELEGGDLQLLAIAGRRGKRQRERARKFLRQGSY